MIRKVNLVIFGMAMALVLSNCAGTVARSTQKSERDMTGQYDGLWQVNIAKGTGIQNHQNWQFQCGDMSAEFKVMVSDSTMQARTGEATTTGYVSPEGKFRITLPVEAEAKESGISDLPLNQGEQRLILRGSLAEDESVGFFTVGIAQFGYAGCTSKVTFQRVPE